MATAKIKPIRLPLDPKEPDPFNSLIASALLQQRPILRMLIGMPRSGKTTLAEEISAAHDLAVLCPKKMAAAIAHPGQEIDGLTDQVAWLLNSTIGWYIASESSVIVDACHLTRESRAAIIQMAKAAGMQVLGYVLTCSPDCLAKRFQETGLPAALLPILQSRFELPVPEEGFEQIHYISGESEHQSNPLHCPGDALQTYGIPWVPVDQRER